MRAIAISVSGAARGAAAVVGAFLPAIGSGSQFGLDPVQNHLAEQRTDPSPPRSNDCASADWRSPSRSSHTGCP
jgi:hypothetical protein